MTPQEIEIKKRVYEKYPKTKKRVLLLAGKTETNRTKGGV